MHCASKPYYADPDAMAAKALTAASSILAEAGFLADAERHAAAAAALFENVPYDRKKRAKVLGDVRYLPNGVIAAAESGTRASYRIPAPPYRVDQAEDDAAVQASIRKDIRDTAVRAACAQHFGWPASAQLAAAVTGSAPRPAGRTLAKALSILAPAVDAMQAAGWSGQAMDMFRDAVSKSGLLRNDALGAQNSRHGVRAPAGRGTIVPDEGAAGRDGGWIAWLPPDACEALAAEIVSGAGSGAPDWRAVYDAIDGFTDRRKAAWFPGMPLQESRGPARAIAEEAARSAAAGMGGAVSMTARAVDNLASAVHTAFTSALRARAMFHAAEIFQEAADRDQDTNALFRSIGILPAKGRVPAGGGTEWFCGIAAASVQTGFYGNSWRWLEQGPSGPATEGDQKEFVRLAEARMRRLILEWSRTPEAEALFRPAPGAYLNCPVPAETNDKKEERT